MKELSGRPAASVKAGPAKRRGRAPALLLAALLGIGIAAPMARAQQDLTTGSPAEAAALQSGTVHPLVGPALMARLVQLTGHRLQQAAMAGPTPSLMADAGGFLYGIDFYQCVATGTPDPRPQAAEPAGPGPGAGPGPAPGTSGAPRCASIRFSTAIDMPAGMAPSAANAWNRDRRFGRLWLDAEGDPHLEMDVSTAGGVTTAHLVDLLDWWALVMNDFVQQVRDGGGVVAKAGAAAPATPAAPSGTVQ